MFALRTALARAPRVVARNVARRNASSHATPKASSDLPWIIGSIAFTVPAAGYLLTSGGPSHAHADEHHSVKETVHEITSKAPTTVAEVKETASSAVEAVKAAVPAVSQKVEEVKESAPAVAKKAEEVKETAAEKTEEVKAAVPSKPVEAVKEAVKTSPATTPSKADPAHAQKPIESGPASGKMSGKQEGLSNTDTVHTLLNTERGDSIARKAEGVHETAKLKGTVDPSSPAEPKTEEAAAPVEAKEEEEKN